MQQIKNYPNYLIDEFGKIYNNKLKRFIKPYVNKNGYYQIRLTNEISTKKLYLHRLLAINFIDNKLNKKYINHINGIKTDNRVENIEWCTHSENMKHAFKIGLKKNSKDKIEKFRLSRIKLVLDTQTGIFYESATEAAFAKNINVNNLTQRLRAIRPNFTSLKYV